MFRESDGFLYDVNDLPPDRVSRETPLTIAEARDNNNAAKKESDMKFITASSRPSRLDNARQTLSNHGGQGITVADWNRSGASAPANPDHTPWK